MRRPSELRAAWAAIDLDALGSNLRHLEAAARAKGYEGLRAVLKADAYGHGAVAVARHLAGLGVERFAVALVEEGIALRRAGCESDLLVMGPCRPEQRDAVREHRLVPTISSASQLESWCAVSGADEPIRVHVKVNTGMNRLGVPPRELPSVLEAIRGADSLTLGGLMSHLADASDPESSQNGLQGRRFEELLEALTPAERASIELHLANSAGLLHQPRHGATVARPGLALLGYDPAGRDHDLSPVMAVIAQLGQIHHLSPGDRVGYGGRWRAAEACRIAIVPVGYADGYAWRLGDRSEALVGGRRVPVVGAVSMDMLAVELGSSAAVEGDEIVLLGRQGEEAIDAVELAERAATVSYEICCGFGLRLPKLYLVGGEVVSAVGRTVAELPSDATPSGTRSPS